MAKSMLHPKPHILWETGVLFLLAVGTQGLAGGVRPGPAGICFLQGPQPLEAALELAWNPKVVLFLVVIQRLLPVTRAF